MLSPPICRFDPSLHRVDVRHCSTWRAFWQGNGLPSPKLTGRSCSRVLASAQNPRGMDWKLRSASDWACLARLNSALPMTRRLRGVEGFHGRPVNPHLTFHPHSLHKTGQASIRLRSICIRLLIMLGSLGITISSMAQRHTRYGRSSLAKRFQVCYPPCAVVALNNTTTWSIQ